MDNLNLLGELDNKELDSLLVYGIPYTEENKLNIKRKFAQAVPQKPLVRKLRWSVAAVVAACLVFATVVYAATVIIERFDTGGSMALTPVTYDSIEYQEQRASMFFARPVYANNRAEFLPPFVLAVSHDYFEGFDSDIAQMINEALAGKIFTADGMPFVLMVAMPNQDLYYADDRGNVLYDADGYEIGMISTLVTFDGEFTAFDCDGFLWVEILTVGDLRGQLDYSATYEDALDFLGRNFRLPTVHIEGFEPPKFRLDGLRVNIRYVGGEAFFEGLFLFVENIRDDSVEPSHLYTTSEIIELEIAGVTIHKIAQQNAFWWRHDDLVYSLSPSVNLTDRQIEEIIMSMIY